MANQKKRKIDAECRVFKDSWAKDFFVCEQKGNILCLICQEKVAVYKEYNVKRHYTTKHATEFDNLIGQIRIDRANSLKQALIGQQSFFKAGRQNSEAATKISYLISEAIARRGKPLSDGEFVKDCLGILTSVAFPDKQAMVEKISLSHQTIARRVDDLSSNIADSLTKRLGACQFYSLGVDESTDVSDTAQLAIFVRGVTKEFQIVEELLDLCSMKGKTTGQDIFNDVKRVLLKFNLPEDKLCGLTTDGAPAMIGKHNGFVSLMAKSVPQNVITHHCIIHQEQLCAKALEMTHVMEKVVSTVNFIRAKGLNHRQFQAFLAEMGADHDDVIYFCQVRWLSRAATLSRFWSLLNEIKTFMTNKGKDVTFLEDASWLNDLAFLVDITKYLSDLNIKLQGKEQFVNKLYEHIQSFVHKLELFQKQLNEKNATHFTVLMTRSAHSINHDKYSALVGNLLNEFKNRFSDFREHSDELKIFADPFGTNVTNAPDMFQMELIDMQSNGDLKRAFSEHTLHTFYSKYITWDSFPNLSNHALRFIALFGSTYCCEQLFSRLKSIKTKSRSLLTDGHLSGILRIATSSVPADIEHLCKQKQCQVSH
ncbi:general transcription factor II-I repeat domain-containing protein 2A-like [Ambystoma mexicanum]|uniref:general transcription factor II-I repeat domain-containing protein 2A-like n=1 Tax=Ambystoma mexicanum TaxID=8296 RepID=UPI0037E99272